MVGIHNRGAFSPSPAQSVVTAASHSPHGSLTDSPTTGQNSLTKIVVAQVYLLLSTIKEDKDRTRWETQAEQLRKVSHIFSNPLMLCARVLMWRHS
jgi:CCR4-NOT transcription complex subunit 1